MENKKIDDFIYQCRCEKKMTQADLAERIGVSVQSISKWETGKAVPSFQHLNELCTVFDVTLTELLNGEKIENQDTKIGKAEETILSLGEEKEAIVSDRKKLLKMGMIVITLLVILSSALYYRTRQDDYEVNILSVSPNSSGKDINGPYVEGGAYVDSEDIFIPSEFPSEVDFLLPEFKEKLLNEYQLEWIEKAIYPAAKSLYIKEGVYGTLVFNPWGYEIRFEVNDTKHKVSKEYTAFLPSLNRFGNGDGSFYVDMPEDGQYPRVLDEKEASDLLAKYEGNYHWQSENHDPLNQNCSEIMIEIHQMSDRVNYSIHQWTGCLTDSVTYHIKNIVKTDENTFELYLYRFHGLGYTAPSDITMFPTNVYIIRTDESSDQYFDLQFKGVNLSTIDSFDRRVENGKLFRRFIDLYKEEGEWYRFEKWPD